MWDIVFCSEFHKIGNRGREVGKFRLHSVIMCVGILVRPTAIRLVSFF
jgi:hypothetical protein